LSATEQSCPSEQALRKAAFGQILHVHEWQALVVSGRTDWLGNNAEQDLPFNGKIAGISRVAGGVPSHYRHLSIT